MPVFATEVMGDARVLLQDETSVRWPLRELRRWINAGLREIATYRPDSVTSNRVVALRAGSLQIVPGLKLLRVVRNSSMANNDGIRTGGAAVTAVAREIMDTQHPNWSNPAVFTPTKAVTHVVFDEEDPRSFYVWPPNDGTGRLEIVIAVAPTPLPLGNPIERLTSYAVELGIDDTLHNALVSYVVSRCYQKDAAFGGNRERAAEYRAEFLALLGVKDQNAARSPNTQSAGQVPPARGG